MHLWGEGVWGTLHSAALSEDVQTGARWDLKVSQWMYFIYSLKTNFLTPQSFLCMALIHEQDWQDKSSGTLDWSFWLNASAPMAEPGKRSVCLFTHI